MNRSRRTPGGSNSSRAWISRRTAPSSSGRRVTFGPARSWWNSFHGDPRRRRRINGRMKYPSMWWRRYAPSGAHPLRLLKPRTPPPARSGCVPSRLRKSTCSRTSPGLADRDGETSCASIDRLLSSSTRGTPRGPTSSPSFPGACMYREIYTKALASIEMLGENGRIAYLCASPDGARAFYEATPYEKQGN